jgi:hypothetical protein
MATDRSVVAANRTAISYFFHFPSPRCQNTGSSKAWCWPLGEARDLTFTTSPTHLLLQQEEKYGGCSANNYANKFLNIQFFWDMTPCRLANSSWYLGSKQVSLKLK